MTMKRLVWVSLVLIAATTLLFGCKGGGGSGGGTPGDDGALYDTTSVSLAIGGGGASSLAQPLAALGTFADVARVAVEVAGEDRFGVFQDPLAAAELTQDVDGVWRATIADLPIGPTLTFTAHGYDAADVEIFSGSATQALTGVGDLVAIAMTAVGDGVPIAFPRIDSISVPAEIVHDTGAAVSVAVTGSPDETLLHAFFSGGGTFAPASGTILLPASGTGTVNATYTAPSAVGTYDHAVRVTSSLGNAVEADFSTTVVNDVTSPEVVVSFAPVVTGILGKRTGGDVTWTVTATDDKDVALLTYGWSFAQSAGTPGAAFTVSGANPGVLSGYDETVAGTVTLTVTDGDGLSTTVTFALNAGQFPDSLAGTLPSTGSITISSASGLRQPADGSWYQCYFNGGTGDTKEVHHYQGGSFIRVEYAYPSTDGTCSGVPSLVPGSTITASMAEEGDYTVAAWSSGASIVPAPLAIDGSTLPANPVATQIGDPLVGHLGALIDDTGTPWRMYRDHDQPAPTCTPTGDVALCLHSIDYLTHVAPLTGPLLVNSASDVLQPMDGTWVNCWYDSDAGIDQYEEWTVSGTSVSILFQSYATTGGTCGGTPTVSATADGIMSPQGGKTVPWTDYASVVAAPPAADGGVLPDPVSGTKVELFVTASSSGDIPVGLIAQWVWFIDDSTAAWRLYRAVDSPSPACDADADGYGGCMYTDPDEYHERL